jgi:TonB family protein
MTPFADVLLAGVSARADRHERTAVPVALVGALALHLAAGALGLLPPTANAAELPPVELSFELAAEKPPEPPAPKPEDAPPAPDAPKPSAAAKAPPPAAARAGALLTARDDAPKTSGEGPVRFVTDPNGASYGSGVVARGGAADVAGPGAVAGGARDGVATTRPNAPSADRGEGLVDAKDWSRPPRLDNADACKGYFPEGAAEDAGVVVVKVVVKASGAIGSIAVIAESPPGEGFGAATRACLSSKRFEPALGSDGRAVAAATTVRIRFTR